MRQLDQILGIPDEDNPNGRFLHYFTLMKPLIEACIDASWSLPKMMPFEGNIRLLLPDLMEMVKSKPWLIIEYKPFPSWLRLDIDHVREYVCKLGITDNADFQAKDVLRILKSFEETGLPCLESFDLLRREIPQAYSTAHYLVQYLHWIYRVSMVLVMTADVTKLMPLSEEAKRPFVSVFSIYKVPNIVKDAVITFVGSINPDAVSPLSMFSTKEMRNSFLCEESEQWRECILDLMKEEISLLQLPSDIIGMIAEMSTGGENDICISVHHRLMMCVTFSAMNLMFKHSVWSYMKPIVYHTLLLKSLITMYGDDDPSLQTLFAEIQAMIGGAPLNRNAHPLLQRAVIMHEEKQRSLERIKERKEAHIKQVSDLRTFRGLPDELVGRVRYLTCDVAGGVSYDELHKELQLPDLENKQQQHVHFLTYVFALCGKTDWFPRKYQEFKKFVLGPLTKALECLKELKLEGLKKLKSFVDKIMILLNSVTDEDLQPLVDPILGEDGYLLFKSQMAQMAKISDQLKGRARVVDLHYLLKRLLEKVFDNDTLERVYADLQCPVGWIKALKERLGFPMAPGESNFIVALTFFNQERAGNAVRDHLHRILAFLNQRRSDLVRQCFSLNPNGIEPVKSMFYALIELDMRKNLSNQMDKWKVVGDEVDAVDAFFKSGSFDQLNQSIASLRVDVTSHTKFDVFYLVQLVLKGVFSAETALRAVVG